MPRLAGLAPRHRRDRSGRHRDRHLGRSLAFAFAQLTWLRTASRPSGMRLNKIPAVAPRWRSDARSPRAARRRRSVALIRFLRLALDAVVISAGRLTWLTNIFCRPGSASCFGVTTGATAKGSAGCRRSARPRGRSILVRPQPIALAILALHIRGIAASVALIGLGLRCDWPCLPSFRRSGSWGHRLLGAEVAIASPSAGEATPEAGSSMR